MRKTGGRGCVPVGRAGENPRLNDDPASTSVYIENSKHYHGYVHVYFIQYINNVRLQW